MLAKYADKHKKDFAAWVKEKVDRWRCKEGYVRENGKEAMLDNVLSFMLSKKGLYNEEFMGFSPGKLRAALSEKMRSLDDIKGRREQLLTHKMLYWNKEKARRWTGVRGLQFPTGPYPERAYEDNVYTPADLTNRLKLDTFLTNFLNSRILSLGVFESCRPGFGIRVASRFSDTPLFVQQCSAGVYCIPPFAVV